MVNSDREEGEDGECAGNDGSNDEGRDREETAVAEKVHVTEVDTAKETEKGATGKCAGAGGELPNALSVMIAGAVSGAPLKVRRMALWCLHNLTAHTAVRETMWEDKECRAALIQGALVDDDETAKGRGGKTGGGNAFVRFFTADDNNDDDDDEQSSDDGKLTTTVKRKRRCSY